MAGYSLKNQLMYYRELELKSKADYDRTHSCFYCDCYDDCKKQMREMGYAQCENEVNYPELFEEEYSDYEKKVNNG